MEALRVILSRITVVVALVLVASLLLPALAPVPTVSASPGSTIYVPDDYPTIQAAVDAASADDTIIVRDGTYTENVDVNKECLTIRSENGAEAAIVQALNPDNHVLCITADNVTVEGLYIYGTTVFGWAGIQLHHVEGCTIARNHCGWDPAHRTSLGIYLYFSDNNTVWGNICSHNYLGGIGLATSLDNTLLDNTCSNNDSYGIRLWDSSGNNTLSDNTCSNNGSYGMYLDGSYGIGDPPNSNGNNTVSGNTCSYNSRKGIYLHASNDNNTIYLNDFRNNVTNAYSHSSGNTWNSPEEIAYTYNSNTYTNYLGNYWDDYTGSDADGDGIGDTPYSIDSDNDNYPLMEPFENYARSGLADSPWPMFLHDPQHTGRSPYIGPQGDLVKWLFDLPDVPLGWRVDNGSAIGPDGTIYLATAQGLYAIDPEGGVLWLYEPSNVPWGGKTPAIGPDGAICVVGHDGVSVISANGSVKSNVPVAGYYHIVEPVLNQQGMLYYAAGCLLPGDQVQPCLIAFAPDGDVLWVYDLANDTTYEQPDFPLGEGLADYSYPYHGPTTSPTIDHNGIIYIGYEQSLVAINPDGMQKWKKTFDVVDIRHPNVGTPSIGSDGTIYVSVSRTRQDPYARGETGSLYAIDPNGGIKWGRDFGGTTPLIGSDGTLYIAYANYPVDHPVGHLVALDAQGNGKWSKSFPNAFFTPRVVDAEGAIYARGYRSVGAWDAAGNEKWWWHSGGDEVYSLSLGQDGTLYVATRSALCAFGPRPDTTSPAAVTDLTVTGATTDSVTLAWTAPGDDGNVGTASGYDIRYSTWEITEANWDSATQYTGEPAPQPAGNTETFVVTGLSPGITYYFGLKSADEVPNWSGLSNVATGTTEVPIAKPVITSPLEITAKDTYYVGDTLTAEFSITNKGTRSVTLDVVVVGGRGPTGEVVDFEKGYDVTLDPGDSYDYRESLTLPDKAGIYHFFCAYHTEEHIPGEDEYNWNTNIDVEIDGEIVGDLNEAMRYRERDITVFEKTYISPAPLPALWDKIGGPWEEEKWDISSELSLIAVHPNNPEVTYAVAKYDHYYWGYIGDRLYKSTNGEANWNPMNEGLPRAPGSEYYWPIRAIAIAPSNPDIIYVGTSAFDPYSDLSSTAKGIYKSTNGGSEWIPIDGPYFTTLWIFKGYYPVSSMAVHPADPNVVYVGTVGGGIWRTTNGGGSWEKIWDLPINRETVLEIISLGISPANPSIIYAAAYNFVPSEAMCWSGILIPAHLIKSEDSGDTWETLQKLPFGKIDDIAVSETNAEMLYIITGVTQSYRVKMSVDGGKTWNDASGSGGLNPLPDVDPVLRTIGIYGTRGKMGSILIHPDYSRVIYASGEWGFKYVYFSSDSGENWFPFGDLEHKHVKGLVLASNADSRVLYAATIEGLYKVDISNSAIIIQQHSPAELRVYDSQGRVTGLVNGKIKEEIPNSACFDNTAIIFSPSDSYRYQIVGTDTGTYGLAITSVEDEEINTFTATDVPTASGAVHQYTIDWDALSGDEEGVIVQIDSDGDGTFEQTITSDDELTHDEFVLQTATAIDFDPDTLNLGSKGKFATVYIELPLGYEVQQINVSSIRLNGIVTALTKPTELDDYDSDGIPDLMVKFDRSAVQDILSMGNQVEITITGEVAGISFEGSDAIRVIDEKG